MTKPQTAHRQHGLTTSEMVVYPMIAVLLVSVAFAAAHSIGVEQDWFTFAFRFLVGVILGAVFLKRGFGVAVGAHVLYNIAVSLLY